MPTKTTDPSAPSHVLDDPARASLLGAHARFTESVGSVLRYQPDVSIFVALPPDPGEQDWRDAAKLLGPDGVLPTGGTEPTPPPGWEQVLRIPGVQMVAQNVAAAPDPEAVRLGAADVDDMLELIAQTNPGPFRHRTVELGTYLGIRRGGRLIAMAGERLHPPGWTEISAVCTHADFRGQGLATRLVHAVAHGIVERGETPFLHTGAGNVTAIRLYEALGFRLRREVVFAAWQVPVQYSE
ncbi:GNAT family N-acetyltransferase [Catenulispora pinisilvae]|uniref:GNAT family N-acetyltransferase n=1 Tax=Catenulispora pinisilvae TaxID=2705253 RepID=UPI00189209BC|nr:GNAT family N-acetyltransferase [Catenulispora pinisilvae]